MTAAKPFSRDAARGMLVGLAVGDAVGTTLEFTDRATLTPVSDMVGGGPFALPPGAWTDDTSMALCLADSLLSQGGFDAGDCMHRFVGWREHGENSSTGSCFDIGTQTSAALDRFVATGDPYAGPTDDAQSGNGGIMRLAPVVLAYGAAAEAPAAAQSRTTHASPACLDGARAMARHLIAGSGWPAQPEPPAVASGWIVHTMDAAHWALGAHDSFKAVILAAANLGGDADTVAAVAGQYAGRLYGYSGIPDPWLARLQAHDHILALADALYDLDPRP